MLSMVGFLRGGRGRLVDAELAALLGALDEHVFELAHAEVALLERAVGLAKAGAPTFEVEDDE